MTNAQNNLGFTIIELMLTVTLLAVMVGIAVPGFATLMQNNNLTTSTNRFVSNLSLARNEALSKNTTVIMCTITSTTPPLAYPLSCATDGFWETGWIIAVDPDGSNNFDEEEIMFVAESMPNGFTLRSENTVFTNRVAYSSAGDATGDLGSAADIFNLCDADADTTRGRSIHLNGVGRAWVNLNPGTNQCP